ncbi:hypothetical protein [Saccharopolyspora spinosa]|uniref:Uncharacterized protein n=1 Tax=Saccharopolyspora spinosa TaxID=60894 RepID=A0A2N3Y315_SACSN|nr:hypothetical protein [Saccharopolyspora spinosa]PKW17302.1 hypothetical protein A8926_5251 [Saccharopolyspora spinosa]
MGIALDHWYHEKTVEQHFEAAERAATTAEALARARRECLECGA